MYYYFLRVLISACIIVAIAEISKRSIVFGSIVASIPIVSVLGIIWFYRDTQNIVAVSELSKGIFFMVIPSLIFFVALPTFLKLKWSFPVSLIASLAIMVCGYFLMLLVLKSFGVKAF